MPYCWPEGTIRFNRTRLNEDFRDHTRRLPRDADVTREWARTLNTAFKQGLYHLYYNKLRDNAKQGDIVDNLLDVVFPSIICTDLLLRPPERSVMEGVAWAGLAALLNAVHKYSKAHRLDRQIRPFDRRVSIFPNCWEADRLALAAGLTALGGPLIGVRNAAA